MLGNAPGSPARIRNKIVRIRWLLTKVGHGWSAGFGGINLIRQFLVNFNTTYTSTIIRNRHRRDARTDASEVWAVWVALLKLSENSYVVYSILYIKMQSHSPNTEQFYIFIGIWDQDKVFQPFHWIHSFTCYFITVYVLGCTFPFKSLL